MAGEFYGPPTGSSANQSWLSAPRGSFTTRATTVGGLGTNGDNTSWLEEVPDGFDRLL